MSVSITEEKIVIVVDPEAPVTLVDDVPSVHLTTVEQPITLDVQETGAIGPKGDKGDKGDPGTSVMGGDLNFRHQQLTPSAIWDITHGLGKRPVVQAFDSSGDEWEGEIDHISDNRLIITFSAAFGGEAYLN